MTLELKAPRHASAQLWLGALASPRLSVTFFVLMAAAAYWSRLPERSATIALAVPFALLTINLLAAILTNRRFRADLPLLVFHLALLALVVSLVAARLTYFEGQATVTSSTTFDGQLLGEESGPLHQRTIDRVRFVNLGFTENFPERGTFHATYNRVRWHTADGKVQTADIGDDVPLIIDGYRIYTTRHRGFSPLFRWQTPDGRDEFGTVQLRDSNNEAFAGANDWTLPTGQQAWLMVDQDASAPAETTSARIRSNLGARTNKHRIILRIGDDRHILAPGDQLTLGDGTLTYVRLDSWMGYRIVSDPTKPWLIACVGLAVLSLVWFYARILFRPILQEQPRS